MRAAPLGGTSVWVAQDPEFRGAYAPGELVRAGERNCERLGRPGGIKLAGKYGRFARPQPVVQEGTNQLSTWCPVENVHSIAAPLSTSGLACGTGHHAEGRYPNRIGANELPRRCPDASVRAHQMHVN